MFPEEKARIKMDNQLRSAGRDTALSISKQPIKQPIKQLEMGQNHLSEILGTAVISQRTERNILNAYHHFGVTRIFGRQDLMKLLGITERPATELIRRMRELQVIERVDGAGRGRYHFIAVKE